jgi:hypothetical protein
VTSLVLNFSINVFCQVVPREVAVDRKRGSLRNLRTQIQCHGEGQTLQAGNCSELKFKYLVKIDYLV